ncbi:hypothetical protein [Methanobrevibacter sp.]|uniref:glycosyltransferase family 39 protein n=1 Tax=Methanobrevibacter sp. TaxID=66852 RepID=UPI00388DC19A
MQSKKEILGKTFFTLSIIFLIYLLITPLNHLICQIDEYFTLTITNLPVQDIITVTAGDVHPPLYYLMAKVVVEISKIFDLNVLFNLKLLNIVAFVLILIISITKIRKDYGWFTAGLFAFSISIMSGFSRYYLIARMYIWAALFIIIVFLAFKNIIYNKYDKKSWIIFTLFSVLAAYINYFAAITAICIYLILLTYLIKNRKSEIKNWIVSVIVGIVLYLPWAFVVISQIIKVKNDYWQPPLRLEEFIHFFGYYAYNTNLILCTVSILFLVILAIIFLKASDNFSKKDQIIILGGFGTYIGFILIGILVCEIYRPILEAKHIIPAAAVLWLVLSIMLGKIKNKKLFLINLTVISLLLLSGIANTVMTYDHDYHEGQLEKDYFTNIARDNNSILIIATPNDIMFYLCCSTDIDTYCINVSDVFSLSSDELHRHYNYKDINGTQINELVLNNSDKNIYYMYFGKSPVNLPEEQIITDYVMHYSKINTTNMTTNQKELHK